MFATMLARVHLCADGDEVIAGSARFSDVPADSIYAASINWCAEQGIVAGSGGGLFLPDSAVTREDLAVILYRYAARSGYLTGASGDLGRFTDGAAVSGYAREAVSWAVGAGMLSGKPDGRLDPSGTATRAQTVTILVQFMDAAGI